MEYERRRRGEKKKLFVWEDRDRHNEALAGFLDFDTERNYVRCKWIHGRSSPRWFTQILSNDCAHFTINRFFFTCCVSGGFGYRVRGISISFIFHYQLFSCTTLWCALFFFTLPPRANSWTALFSPVSSLRNDSRPILTFSLSSARLCAYLRLVFFFASRIWISFIGNEKARKKKVAAVSVSPIQ